MFKPVLDKMIKEHEEEKKEEDKEKSKN